MAWRINTTFAMSGRSESPTRYVVMIACLRGHLPAREQIDGDEAVAISIITWIEVMAASTSDTAQAGVHIPYRL